MDWSGSGPEFRLCVAALKEDLSEIARLIPLAVRSEAISQENLANWPVFNFVRKSEEFTNAYKQMFGTRSDIEDRAGSYDVQPAPTDSKPI